MVTCEASGAREHGHDSKHEASIGRTNNARKGVDESVWAVQLVEHVGKEAMEEVMIKINTHKCFMCSQVLDRLKMVFIPKK
jgi:hypothetical protein